MLPDNLKSVIIIKICWSYLTISTVFLSVVKPGFHEMFQGLQQIEVVCSCERYCVLPVSIGNYRQVCCEIFRIWRYVNGVTHPVLSWKQRLSESRCYIVVIYSFAFFFRRRKFFFCSALSIPTGHSHSISWHRPRIPSQKFNMCDFVASTQAFIAKAGIACDHWCPYILRHRALLCVPLTHVWKLAFMLKLPYNNKSMFAIRLRWSY